MFDCEQCGIVHRMNQNALLGWAALAAEGYAHYVTREAIPFLGRVTVIKAFCPFDLGFTRTRMSEISARRKVGK